MSKVQILIPFRAPNINPDLQLWHWYKDLVLAGAQEHGLPWSYIQAIRETRAPPGSQRCSEAQGRIHTHSTLNHGKEVSNHAIM